MAVILKDWRYFGWIFWRIFFLQTVGLYFPICGHTSLIEVGSSKSLRVCCDPVCSNKLCVKTFQSRQINYQSANLSEILQYFEAKFVSVEKNWYNLQCFHKTLATRNKVKVVCSKFFRNFQSIIRFISHSLFDKIWRKLLLMEFSTNKFLNHVHFFIEKYRVFVKKLKLRFLEVILKDWRYFGWILRRAFNP